MITAVFVLAILVLPAWVLTIYIGRHEIDAFAALTLFLSLPLTVALAICNIVLFFL